MINWSQFLIIGETSVLSFNIIGIVKTCLVLMLGWWVEGKVIGLKDAVGVLLAIGGSFAYSQFRD